jgi:hypothetical protein
LQGEHRSGHEAALGGIRVELDFDRAFEPVRLREPTNPQLGLVGRGNCGLSHRTGRLEVGVDDVDAHASTVGERRNQSAKGFRGAPGAADDSAEIVGMHANLKHLAALGVLGDNLHLIGVIHDPFDQVLKRWSKQD